MVPYVRLIPVEPPGHKHGSAAEDGQFKEVLGSAVIDKDASFHTNWHLGIVLEDSGI